MKPEEIAALVAKSVKEAVEGALVEAKKSADTELAKRDFEIAVLKLSPAHKAYLDDCDAATQKTFATMKTDGERDDFMSKNPRKRAVDPASSEDLAKRDTKIAAQDAEIADLKKRLNASDEKEAIASFEKRAVDAGLTKADGEIMRKAYANDAAAQVKLEKRFEEVRKAAAEVAKTNALFAEFGHVAPIAGDALTELNTLAAAYQKTEAGKGLTKEQAFAKVYEDPANAEVVKRSKMEEVAKRQKASA